MVVTPRLPNLPRLSFNNAGGEKKKALAPGDCPPSLLRDGDKRRHGDESAAYQSPSRGEVGGGDPFSFFTGLSAAIRSWEVTNLTDKDNAAPPPPPPPCSLFIIISGPVLFVSRTSLPA